MRHLPEIDITWETPVCILCGGSNHKPLITTFDYEMECDIEFTVVRCDDCGLCFLSPRPILSQIIEYFYPDDYLCFVRGDQGEASQPGFVERLLDEQCNGPRRKTLKRFFGDREISVLDVGCGDGYLLQHFRNKTDWDIRGLEPNSKMAELLVKAGFHVDCGLLEDIAYPEASFDAVILTHVLEHTDNPLNMLKEIYRILKPDGLLLVEVPNFNAFSRKFMRRYWWGYHLPRHTYHYTLETLEKLGQAAGLTAHTKSSVPRLGFQAWSFAVFLEKSNFPGAASLAQKLTKDSRILNLFCLPLELVGFLLKRTEAIEMTFVK